MRPMTAREALELQRTGALSFGGDYGQALRILDALVEWREAQRELDYHLRYSPPVPLKPIKWRRRKKVLERGIHAAERKLAALERGEEPQAWTTLK